MKSIIKPGIVLLIVCVVAAAVLGYVNAITAKPIEEADAKTKAEKMNEIYETQWGEEVVVEGNEKYPSVTSYVPSADGSVCAISTESNGFAAGLKLMFGIDKDGKIVGMSVVDCANETPGLGANIATTDSFREQFVGKEGNLAVEKDGGEIVAITGATITSRAVSNAANEAVGFYNDVIKEGGAN